MQKNSQLKTFLLALAAIAVATPVIPLLAWLGRPELERPAFFAAATLAVAIEVCRGLRGRLWFWILTIAIAACHVPLVVLLPWHAGWIPAPVIFLACLADFLIILAIIGFIEKLLGRTADLS
jgi:hypothetical protein